MSLFAEAWQTVMIVTCYISANSILNRPSYWSCICFHRRWNVSGEIVLSHLAGRSQTWRKQVLGRTLNTSVSWTFGSYRSVAKTAGFHSESCGIGSLSRVLEVPTMMTTILSARSTMPGFGIDVPPYNHSGISAVFPREKRPCTDAVSASKHSGLLLSDRKDFLVTLAGFYHFPSSDLQKFTPADRRLFVPRKPVYGLSRLFFFAKLNHWFQP